jgi:exodeoxyribonuclease III
MAQTHSLKTFMRIITINLNGIRSAAEKGFFSWLAEQDADIVCLQEVRAQSADMTAQMLAPAGYHGYFHYAEKKGYSGVGIYSRIAPLKVTEGLGIAEFDAEGRYLRADFDGYSVISVYLPSGSSGEARQAVKYSFMAAFQPHLHALQNNGLEAVVCGDWNIAHREIDLKNWRGNRKNSGFLPEERAWLSRLFDESGFVDVFRNIHPQLEAYTWWSNRGRAWDKDVGWRLDYQIATPGIAARAAAASIYKAQRFSDHAPLIIDYPCIAC